MPTLPIIHSRQEADAGGYRRETIDLEFSNGERRKYERLSSRGHGAVMIAAIPEPGTVLLIREYAAGVHRYDCPRAGWTRARACWTRPTAS